MTTRILSGAVAGLALFTTLSSAQALETPTRYDPRQSFCGRTYAKSIVAAQTLFVDGGEYMDSYWFTRTNSSDPTLLKESDGVGRWMNEHLWSLDLAKPFLTKRPPWNIQSKPKKQDEHYNGAQGVMWSADTSGTSFETMGGWNSLRLGPAPGGFVGMPMYDGKSWELPDPKIFKYDVMKDEWTNRPISKNQDVKRIGAAAHVVSVSEQLGFVLGGSYVDEEAEGRLPTGLKSESYLRTMSIYDFKSEEWRAENLPSEMQWPQDGFLNSIESVGKKGILTYIGGETRTQNGTLLREDLTYAWVYDIDSRTWFKQPTSGNIAPGRSQGCSVVVPAPDLSSYQIYIMGGTSQSGEALHDLWVLTVPGFVWTELIMDGSNGYPDDFGMNTHSCTSANNGRMMLIVPGEKNASRSDPEFVYSCQADIPIHVFDTNEYKFLEEWDPTATELAVPSRMQEVTGSKSTGGATMKKPFIGGWVDDDLSKVWAVTRKDIPTRGDGPTGRPNPTNNPNDDDFSDSDDNKKGPPVGAIVGGVVGGVILIALIGARIWFWKRNKARRSAAAELGGEGTVQPPRPDMKQTQYVSASPYTHEAPNFVEPSELGDGERPAMLAANGPGYQSAPISPNGEYGFYKPEDDGTGTWQTTHNSHQAYQPQQQQQPFQNSPPQMFSSGTDGTLDVDGSPRMLQR